MARLDIRTGTWVSNINTVIAADCVATHGTTATAIIPDSKVHGANMGPIWGRQDPGGPHVGPMNLAIWDSIDLYFSVYSRHDKGYLTFNVYATVFFCTSSRAPGELRHQFSFSKFVNSPVRSSFFAIYIQLCQYRGNSARNNPVFTLKSVEQITLSRTFNNPF